VKELTCLGRFENPVTNEVFTHNVISIEQNWFLECGDDDYPSIPNFINWTLNLMMEDLTSIFYYKLHDRQKSQKVTKEYKEIVRENKKCPPFFRENQLFKGKYYMVSVKWGKDNIPFIEGVYQDRLFDFDINVNIKKQERLNLRDVLYSEHYYAFEQSLIKKTESGYQFID
jgi:hypothetical protein